MYEKRILLLSAQNYKVILLAGYINLAEVILIYHPIRSLILLGVLFIINPIYNSIKII